MPHWIVEKSFQFYVAKNSGLKIEIDIATYIHIEGGFSQVRYARAFASMIADGLNFVMIYDSNGKVVCTFAPTYDWKSHE